MTYYDIYIANSLLCTMLAASAAELRASVAMEQRVDPRLVSVVEHKGGNQ